MADFTKIRLIDDYLSSVSGSITVTGSITATTFNGDGSELNGIITDVVFNTFTSSYTTGSFTGSFTGDGSGLVGIDASLLDFNNVPISSSGVPTGSLYKENGFLKIVE
jgi:hypothetical protein